MISLTNLRSKSLSFLYLSVLAGMVNFYTPCFAQTSPAPQNTLEQRNSTDTQSKSTSPTKLEGRPIWNDLNADQKIALEPLQKLWPQMSEFQKQKWLVISKNYMSMGSDEQTRLQSRMNDWVSLSNQERAVARLNFAEVNKLSEDQKRVKWEAYQALEPDARQKLLDSTQPLPKGAAIAVHPTNKALLTITPETASTTSTKHVASPLPRIDISQISTQTLLVIPKHANTDKSGGQSVK